MAADPSATKDLQPKRRPWELVLSTRGPGVLSRAQLAVLALSFIFFAFVVAWPEFVGTDPVEVTGAPLQEPGSSQLFGTDEQGRDLLSRVAYGMRTSLLAAVAVIASGVIIGGGIGLIAGIAGGFVDAALMRITDLFLALPGPLLALAVVAALGPSLFHTLVAISIVWWPWYARVVRGVVRGTMTLPHVEAARLNDLGRLRIAVKHVLPSAFAPLIVTASLDVGNLILLLAGLSFLGLGSPQPAPELGAMTASGLTYLFTGWWVAVIPAAAVTVLVLIANLAGDAVVDWVGS
jgi:peptide/nickel transport system permease protein